MTRGLDGLCYSEGCMYVVGEPDESGRDSLSLTVYRVQSDSGHITQLDTLTLLGTDYWLESQCPRVDRHSRRVFVPCRGRGVTVALLDGDRLVVERTLTCVRVAVSVDVISSDAVYVGDRHSRSVHVVDVRNDCITSTLDKPDKVKDLPPRCLAVLGDSVMVVYGYNTLAVYRHGSPAPVRVILSHGGLREVSAVSTDCRSNFIVTDRNTRSVFIIDINGELHHTVNTDTDSDTDRDTDSWTRDNRPWDCAVVNRHLWVGCVNGDIVIMSSE